MAPSKPNIPPRRCEKCKEQMTHLSDLQPRLGGAPMRIYRCYGCNNVVSEDR